MASVLTDNRCLNCGIPVDAEFFDVNGFIGKSPFEFPSSQQNSDGNITATGFEDLPRRGEQRVLAAFQLHPQYCGVLTYFSQYTDLYAANNSQILTPGFEWILLQNGKPIFPYMRHEMILNPWGYNCLPVAIRLDENARVEFVLRNRAIADTQLTSYPIKAFAGRIMGRYWYNNVFGGR
jgi:hypothetical protein